MKIDVAEPFEFLQRAPIVEAVIQINARPESVWEEKNILDSLKPKLPEYSRIISQTGIRHELKLEGGNPPQASAQQLPWHGLLGYSKDERRIVQFNREGLVFSRLQPYENWERFLDETMHLWKIYLEIGHPVEMQRIGVRFMNRIPLPATREFHLKDYIKPYPEPPSGLEIPFLNFFHHDRLVVPNQPYAVNITRTLQPAQPPVSESVSLILDIDAFTLQPFEIKEGLLEGRLAELRWLKNKAFFGSITSKSLELFK